MTDEQVRVDCLETIIAHRTTQSDTLYDTLNRLFGLLADLSMVEAVGWLSYIYRHVRVQHDPYRTPNFWPVYDRVEKFVHDDLCSLDEALLTVREAIKRVEKERQLEAIKRDFNVADAREVEMLWKLTWGGAR